VAQVILTHNHFDHAAAVTSLKKRYNARIMAFSEGNGVDELLCDGAFVKAGDGVLEVLHTPGHSSDSICLYSPSEKALFSGDTQIQVRWPRGDYSREYIESLLKIAGRDIQKIYSGHDEPITSGGQEIIMQTLRNIQHSKDILNHARGTGD
jgi:glyoxylase-like metal-dependent hydrolase (beta-lactamase superfamily II)